MQKLKGRREFIRNYFIIGLGTIGALSMARCSSDEGSPVSQSNGDPCEDLSGVSKKDLDIRKKAAYVSSSPMPDKVCGNCNLFIPPKEGNSCGSCMLFKGPVETKGYCIYWAPHAT